MFCPYCHYAETKVVDKRDADNQALTRRRRECLKCAKRFTTYERMETNLRVIKKDGRRETFNREKIKIGMLKACEKRPVSAEAIEAAVNKVEAQLRGKANSEVKSRVIGESVSRELKRLDKVAYIRFASVYKDFEDPESFATEVKQLLRRGRKK
ncbi:transcriptional repressor NrdR [Candidatus Woesearchaeota archaeon]|nr:transcriptional repressor NrdR [Candidatus Woesearchaeota archaeon]